MEKRMIIAFVLSFLVLMAWSFLFSPKQEQAPSKEEAGIPQKREGALPESVESLIPRPSIATKGDQKRDGITLTETGEQEIKVETPLYKVIFSTADVTIKSFKLKKYYLTTDTTSPLIELADVGKNEEDFFAIKFDDQSKPKDRKTIYQVAKKSIFLNPESLPQDLTFRSTSSDGVSVNQTFRFYPDNYHLDLLIRVENRSEKRAEGNLNACLKNLPPQKKGYYSFIGMTLLLNEEIEQIKPEKMEEEKHHSGRIDWMAYESDYFISAVIPNEQSEGRFKGHLMPSGIIDATYISPSFALRSQEHILSRFTLYFGPRDLSFLKPIGKKLDLAINFGWTDIIAKPLLHALLFFNRYVHNYGLSIIILTILIKILFWPLTHKSYKSMKEMQKLQPIMAKMREKYKNNKQQMNKELMGLYKTYKVNPMGGCLPMIIQLPVFFALFRLLGSSIELRHAPFLFWINDLSAPDRLFNFSFQIPFMAPPYGIPVLTLLMGASMFIQQKMTPTPGDPAQAKIMMFLPIIFTFMFINFPSGLVLYWLTNNLLSIGQQYRIKKSPT
jgi:YidC/Oxa1 family membrane protein insertase